MKFFVHENIALPLSNILSAYDLQNTFSYFDYPPGTPDEQWVLAVGKERPRPVILSAHPGILSNAVSRQVLKESGCSYVYMMESWWNLAWNIQASKLIRIWDDVTDLIRMTEGQAVVEVPVSAKPRRLKL